MFNPWALLLLLLAFVGNGFYWNARGSNVEHARMMAKLKSQQVEALQNARDINAQWQAKVDTETKLQKAKLDDVQRHLDTVIVSLRNRPSRSDSLPATPRAACQDANGAELAREHGEFLAGYAAIAARQDAALSACYAALDGTR